MAKQSQNQRILDYLKAGNKITQYEAISQFGIMRLASRISDLRSQGYLIGSCPVKVANRFGEETTVSQYWLVKEGEIISE